VVKTLKEIQTFSKLGIKVTHNVHMLVGEGGKLTKSFWDMTYLGGEYFREICKDCIFLKT
jgi:hypothetical protein